jgi:hypothetical protein
MQKTPQQHYEDAEEIIAKAELELRKAVAKQDSEELQVILIVSPLLVEIAKAHAILSNTGYIDLNKRTDPPDGGYIL